MTPQVIADAARANFCLNVSPIPSTMMYCTSDHRCQGWIWGWLRSFPSYDAEEGSKVRLLDLGT